MRTIAHLSDLHFGKIDKRVCHDIRMAVREAAPDLVVVSGDLTQRARTAQFAAARRFLDSLPKPQLVVPGNHDVPLYDIFRRTFRPFHRYRRLITEDLAPFHADGEIAVAGVNTARAMTFKGGRINARQIDEVSGRFAGLPAHVTRIVVTHHPFEGEKPGPDDDVVGRAEQAMAAFARSGVDIILAGHLHSSRVGATAARYSISGYSAVLVQAGTATSRRRREEANSFNLIRIGRPRLDVDRKMWEPGEGFVTGSTRSFVFGSAGWSPVEPAL